MNFMDFMGDNNERKEDADLLELLKHTIGCEYISDLKFEPYNNRAKLILNQLNLDEYPSKQLEDVFEYIYNN